jgi:hypothetical protein
MTIWHRIIHPISLHFRRKRGAFLLEEFPEIRTYKICDVGGSLHFWEKVGLEVPERNITIYNVSDSETGSMQGVNTETSLVIYDGKSIPARDNEFDLCVCNSVLEHVPLNERPALIAEMNRVARNLFCQTPAYEFPFEPHFLMPFIHWIPRNIGYYVAKISVWRLLSRPSRQTIDSYWWRTSLLKLSEIRALFPSADIKEERTLGFRKSYYVIMKATSRTLEEGTPPLNPGPKLIANP